MVEIRDPQMHCNPYYRDSHKGPLKALGFSSSFQFPIDSLFLG